MTPATLSLIVGLVQEAIVVAPGLIDDLQAIFAKADATPADWEALRAKIMAAS